MLAPMSESDSDRLTELEIRLSFQDKLIADLDGFVRVLSARLEKAERELVELKAAQHSPPTPTGPADEPPPHY
jgi:uncharacterized coiled-coil protein SlyX